jgi:hypothetical protein
MTSVHETRARSRWNLNKNQQIIIPGKEIPISRCMMDYVYCGAGFSFFEGAMKGFMDSFIEARQREATEYFEKRHWRLS